MIITIAIDTSKNTKNEARKLRQFADILDVQDATDAPPDTGVQLHNVVDNRMSIDETPDTDITLGILSQRDIQDLQGNIKDKVQKLIRLHRDRATSFIADLQGSYGHADINQIPPGDLYNILTRVEGILDGAT